MKKSYETPSVEVVEFKYRDQVVAASGSLTNCITTWHNDNGASQGCQYGGTTNNER